MSNTVTAPALGQPAGAPTQKRHYDWRMLFLLPAGLAAAHVVSWFDGPLLVHPFRHLAPHSVLLAAAAGLHYLVVLAIVFAPALTRRPVTINRSVLGIDRRISAADVGLGFVFFLAATFTCAYVVHTVTTLLPAIRVHHAQDLPIVVSSAPADMILAFVTMAVMAPLAEELIFRGWLYGRLLAAVPAVPAAFVTSVMFGVAHLFGPTHLQWNVTISTFVFSLFACSLRSMTGKIWAGVVMHALTNAIAFSFIFAAYL